MTFVNLNRNFRIILAGNEVRVKILTILLVVKYNGAATQCIFN